MKSKINFLLLIVLSLSFLKTLAQKEGNIWCFPDHGGMDFNNLTQPDTFTSAIGQTGFGYPGENQCALADSNGNLFCYAAATEWLYSGLQVWDRTHEVMPHGHSLQGHPTQISLLLPQPGNDSLIYLFHLGRDSINTNYCMLFFSTIRNCLKFS